MAKTIVQKVLFKNTTPKALYELYTDSKKHSASTGSNTKISAREGANFSGSNGYISGKNLKLIKDELIVQTWRAVDWDKEDQDSIFIIRLEAKGKDTLLHATHANLPDKHAKSIDGGWRTYYWEPWKKYLAGKPVPRQAAM